MRRDARSPVGMLAGATVIVLAAAAGFVGDAIGAENPAHDPVIMQRIAADRRAQAVNDAERESPDAVRARRVSRSAYRDMTDADALELFSDRFSGLFGGPLWRGVPEGRVRRYVDDHTAILDNGEGAPGGLLRSMLPLRIERNGRKVPARLDLLESGQGWAPAEPLVDVAIGSGPATASRFQGRTSPSGPRGHPELGAAS